MATNYKSLIALVVLAAGLGSNKTSSAVFLKIGSKFIDPNQPHQKHLLGKSKKKKKPETKLPQQNLPDCPLKHYLGLPPKTLPKTYILHLTQLQDLVEKQRAWTQTVCGEIVLLHKWFKTMYEITELKKNASTIVPETSTERAFAVKYYELNDNDEKASSEILAQKNNINRTEIINRFEAVFDESDENFIAESQNSLSPFIKTKGKILALAAKRLAYQKQLSRPTHSADAPLLTIKRAQTCVLHKDVLEHLSTSRLNDCLCLDFFIVKNNLTKLFVGQPPEKIATLENLVSQTCKALREATKFLTEVKP